jgi:hypothetical protein
VQRARRQQWLKNFYCAIASFLLAENRRLVDVCTEGGLHPDDGPLLVNARYPTTPSSKRRPSVVNQPPPVRNGP